MKILNKIYTYLMFIFLYAPVIVLIIFSFNESKSRANFSGFTLKWYKMLFQDTEILKAVSNTLIVALISAIVATILGTIAAVGIMNMKKVKKKVLLSITNLPMINPEIVTGVSLMLLFVFLYKELGIFRPGIITLILAHVTFSLPYVILSVMPKLRQMDTCLYEAALDLGCSPLKAFLKVTIPDIMPGIVSGFVMAFTLSLDDFVISYFVCGTTQTLPISIYSMTRKIVSPEINALSTVLFLAILLLLILINIRSMKKSSSKSRGN